jgi:ABC-type nitrate/sulfonate/bicarbonate transport system substrate-binding protein
MWYVDDRDIQSLGQHALAPAGNVASSMRIVLAAIVGASSAHAAEAETLNLRYGQAYSSAHSIFSLPVSVAEREGLFLREGLNVQVVVPIPGGSDKMIAALHDDWVDVTHVATPFLIRAALAGSDAVAIAAEFRNPVYSLIAKTEINDFAELNGKLVGLADEAGTIGGLSSRRLKLVLEYIEDTLGQPIKLRELAALAGVSARHFERAFRQSTGSSPHAHVMNRRLHRARDKRSCGPIIEQ